MENIGISKLHLKGVDDFTTDFGLKTRKKFDKPFKKACNIFTGANIIDFRFPLEMADDFYFENISSKKVPLTQYKTYHPKKNNIVIERYPNIPKDEPIIFVCNHTCPEDIETVLNVLDRNAYLILGSIETLKHDPEMYLSWLNGMIPFDILDDYQRKLLYPKMERTIKTNSILIFPEGSHNYSPNNIVNPLFDGSSWLSYNTGRRICVVSFLKDFDNNISYVDVSNPFNFSDIAIPRYPNYKELFGLSMQEKKEKTDKFRVKYFNDVVRDKMATGVYHIMERHFETIDKSHYYDLEGTLRQACIDDAFKKLKWAKCGSDVFEAEYLVKSTKADIKHQEVIDSLLTVGLTHPELLDRNLAQLQADIERKNVEARMREQWHYERAKTEYQRRRK